MPQTEETFCDLELRIFPQTEQGYPVEITLSGQQEFPRGYLPAGIVPWTSSGNLMTDGQSLFDTLLADANLRTAWAEARGQSPHRRIRLRIDPVAAELHALPWELVQENGTLLAANPRTPFSRYLPVALPWGGAAEERPIRILVIISNPDDLQTEYDLTPLNVTLERKILTSAFEMITTVSKSKSEPAKRLNFQVDFLDPPVTLERIEEALGKGYHIIHYLGHGAYNARRQQAVLYLQDAQGHAQLVVDDDLVRLVARQNIHPQLIFLAACQSATRSTADAFSGLAPKLVSVGVPAVVAMQDFVAIETVHKLCAAFYYRLLEHGYADQALNEARGALLTAGRTDAACPVLFMRLKSGQLWSTEADARGQTLGDAPHVFWSGLVEYIRQGKCTPIIGPRVHGRWLPTPAEAARRLSEMHKYPFEDKDNLARVAQYLDSSHGKHLPRSSWLETLKTNLISRLPAALRPTQRCNTLTDLVQAVSWSKLVADDPNEPHQVLASLNLPLYLTTNPDNFMAEALAAHGHPATREICKWNQYLDMLPSQFEQKYDYYPTPESPLVYHLFGSDTDPTSLVLTEDDYFDFLVKISAERTRIPAQIKGALANSALLFVGYNLNDWEFRVLMRGLVAVFGQRRMFKHIAV